MDEVVEASVFNDKQNEESVKNIEKYSADFVKMDEAVEADAVPDQHNESSIGALQYNTKKTCNLTVGM